MPTDLTSKISLKQKCKNIIRLAGYVRKIEKGYFLIGISEQTINTFSGYLILILFATILNMLEAGKKAEEIIKIAVCVLVIYKIFQMVVSFLRNKKQVKMQAIAYKYEFMMTEKVMSMDYSLVDSPKVRELRDRISRDNNWGAGINTFFWMVDGFVANILGIVGAVIVGFPIMGEILKTKKIIGILMITSVYVIAIILVKMQMKKQERFNNRLLNDPYDTEQEMAEHSSLIWAFAREEQYDYKNGKDVRIYDGYDLFDKYSYERMEKNERAYVSKTGRMMAVTESMRDGIKSFLFGSGYFVVGFMALGGTIAVGNLYQYAGAMEKLFSGLTNFIWLFWEMALAARKQLSTLDFLELEDEMYKGKLPVEKRSDDEYEIEFENVSFKYPGTEEYALKDLSLKMRIGEKMAIVGMNGSGKTTMIKLLCKLYEPTEGRILLNGVDIRKFREDEYRKLFSVVFQDFKLFELELGENVAGSREYDKDKVVECLKKSGFNLEKEKIPNGLGTFLYKGYDDSGVEISGGEAQKIAIARALYKKSSFILLDEPTAALDPLAENEIYAGFDAIVGTKTAIYISHRLSSCKFCNDIVVFDNGRLIQRGSHEELLKDTAGKYYEMWNAQAQYYN